jgi:hypothetical protein
MPDMSSFTVEQCVMQEAQIPLSLPLDTDLYFNLSVSIPKRGGAGRLLVRLPAAHVEKRQTFGTDTIYTTSTTTIIA